MKKKKSKIILISVLAALFLAVPITCISIGSSGAKQAMTVGTEKSEDNSSKFLSDVGYDPSEFTKKWSESTEQITYMSSDGNNVPMSYTCCEPYEYENTTLILIPPYGYTYSVMYPIADVLLEEGYNVVIYNQRSHGRNTGDTITFGLKEEDDLDTVIEYIKINVTEKPIIGLYGQGMGASTAAYYMGEGYAAQNIDFAILEDPYANASDNIDAALKDKEGIIPSSLYRSLAKTFIKSKYDFAYDSLDISDKVSSTSIPTLVLNQQNCPECPYITSNKVYAAIKNNDKKLVTFSESEYLKAFFDENEKYKNTVLEYISDHLI